MANGKVEIRGGAVVHQQKGQDDVEVVAAKYLHDSQHGMSAEWRLELADGSTVQWTMDKQSYGMANMVQYLSSMPDERPPVVKAEERFRFGIDPKETAEILLRLGNGIGDTVLPQSVTEMVVSSTEDFEMRMLTILYAEKK